MLQLSETKRHMDRAALLKFWEVLDKSVEMKLLVENCYSFAANSIKVSNKLCMDFSE